MEQGTRETTADVHPLNGHLHTAHPSHAKAGSISMVIAGKAVFSYTKGQLVLQEIAEEFSVEDIKNCTDADFIVSSELKTIKH